MHRLSCIMFVLGTVGMGAILLQGWHSPREMVSFTREVSR